MHSQMAVWAIFDNLSRDHKSNQYPVGKLRFSSKVFPIFNIKFCSACKASRRSKLVLKVRKNTLLKLNEESIRKETDQCI